MKAMTAEEEKIENDTYIIAGAMYELDRAILQEQKTIVQLAEQEGADTELSIAIDLKKTLVHGRKLYSNRRVTLGKKITITIIRTLSAARHIGLDVSQLQDSVHKVYCDDFDYDVIVRRTKSALKTLISYQCIEINDDIVTLCK